MIDTRVFPHALDAERALIGGCILDDQQIDDMGALIQPADFYQRHHEALWTLIHSMRRERVHVDLVSVTERVARGGNDALYGGLAYVISLIESVPSTANLAHYAGIIAEHAQRRRMIGALQAAADRLYAAQDDPSQVSAEIRSALDGAESGRPTADEWDDYADLIPRAVEMSQAAASGRAADLLGPLLPFRSLRAYRERARPGSMLVVAALQKVGKSVLARQIAEEIATQGYVVGVYSLEIDGLAVATKTLAATARTDHAIAQAIPLGAVSGMSARELESGQVDGVAWDRVVDAASGLTSLPVRVAKRKNFTVPDLVASMGRLARWARATNRKLGCVVIDYFQLLTVPIARGRNQADALAEASRAIKVAAMEHGICVVLVSQLNRSAAEAKEGLKAHHMRGTSGLESDADMVLLIDRQPASADARFIIPLNRGHQPCPEGFDMLFDGPSEAFACPLDRWW